MFEKMKRFVLDAFRKFQTATPQQALYNLQAHLDSSKPFTSFIDLITKLGVSYAFAVFCLKRAEEQPFYSFARIEFSLSSYVGLALSFVLFTKICSVVIAYYFKDATLWRSLPMRILALAFGIVCYFSLIRGIGELSSSLANAPWASRSHKVITFSLEP